MPLKTRRSWVRASRETKKSSCKCVFNALVLSFVSRRLATDRRFVQGSYQMSDKRDSETWRLVGLADRYPITISISEGYTQTH